jgi:uncharacterized protein YdhG (YjbR/CyaY superfamily)
MAAPRFSSVDDYLASVEPPKDQTIRSIIDAILAGFPELEAKIAWNVPQIHRDGKYVAGVDAAKNHVSVSAWSADVIADFKPRLDAYVVKKNLFQVPVDWDVDEDLLKDMVRARLAELE